MKLIIIFSLVLSILHSILFYENDLGVSVFLFTGILVSLIIICLKQSKKIIQPKALILIIPILLLSLTYFLFNNTIFRMFNMLVIIVMFGIMIILATSKNEKIKQIIEKLFLLFIGPFDLIKEASHLANKHLLAIFRFKSREKRGNIKQITKGFLVALPIVILVCILLISADETFADIFNKIFRQISVLDVHTCVSLLIRIGTIVILTFYGIAFMLNILLKRSRYNLTVPDEKENKGIYINQFTITILLTLLNIVYMIFTYTQIKQLGTQLDCFTLSYSAYARSGFFQLMFVSFINLIVIFATNRNKQEMSKNMQILIKTMNILLCLFTIIILICSMIRMNLYAESYGYTFLRVMVYCIQITELVLIIPTFAYIINKKINIKRCYFVIIITAYIIINFINIDQIIAKNNINRFMEFIRTDPPEYAREALDIQYLKTLSMDALPEIERLLQEVNWDNLPMSYQILKNELINYKDSLQWMFDEDKNIFEWNISFEKAKKIISND